MHRRTCRLVLYTALVALAEAAAPAAQQPGRAPNAAARVNIPIEYRTLSNGLKVVLSRDTSSPTAVVGVYYNIGFRIEPKERTGFAHLFEHMMFQGSQNLGKNAFIGLVQANGGVLNGSTRFDFTNYYEIVPSHTLETVLWAEADRMRGLNITQENLTNQQGVVKNEVRVNVLNQPYGGFPWLDLPQVANTNWYNAHNFYGDLEHLDAATLDDVREFFKTYYTPSNAVLVVSGDLEPAQTMQWVRQYFGGIASTPRKPQPDISEPRQEKEKRANKVDPLATRPALAIGYHTPERHSPEFYALALIDQILLQGQDSRLYEALVRKGGLTGQVSGGTNVGLGNMFDIRGPALWTISLLHDTDKPADLIVKAIDDEIERVRKTPITRADLDLALVKLRSTMFAEQESLYGFGRANLLASFALFDGDPGRINRLEDDFRKVTPELILKTANEYLRPTNRTILTITPKTAAPAGGGL